MMTQSMLLAKKPHVIVGKDNLNLCDVRPVKEVCFQ